MKTGLCITIGALLFLFSNFSMAGCSACSGGCNDSYSYYTETESWPTCDCTDPACGPFAYNDCLGRGECCEAFGNIGAR